MIFEVKKDKFFSTIFYSLFGLILIFIIMVFNTTETTKNWWATGVLIAIQLLLVWIWHGTKYKISNTILNISSGPLKKNIPVRLITKVEIGNTMWIGYKLGLSKGGLIIHYNQYDEIYITPINVDEFCSTLKRIHSEIEIAKNID